MISFVQIFTSYGINPAAAPQEWDPHKVEFASGSDLDYKKMYGVSFAQIRLEVVL